MPRGDYQEPQIVPRGDFRQDQDIENNVVSCCRSPRRFRKTKSWLAAKARSSQMEENTLRRPRARAYSTGLVHSGIQRPYGDYTYHPMSRILEYRALDGEGQSRWRQGDSFQKSSAPLPAFLSLSRLEQDPDSWLQERKSSNCPSTSTKRPRNNPVPPSIPDEVILPNFHKNPVPLFVGRRYLTGRIFARLVSGLGWIMLLLGFAISVISSLDFRSYGDFLQELTDNSRLWHWVLLCYLGGPLLIVIGQLMRAIFEGANAAFWLVTIQRSRLESSR